MRISDWSSDVCSSDLSGRRPSLRQHGLLARGRVGIDVPPRSPLDKGPARRLARGSLLKEEVEEVGQFDRRLARDFADPRVAVPDPVCTLRAGARQYFPPAEAGMSEHQCPDQRSSERATANAHIPLTKSRHESARSIRA